MKITKKQQTAIFKALIDASMCWDPPPSDQTFDSERWEKIGNELIKFLEKIDDYTSDFDPGI